MKKSKHSLNNVRRCPPVTVIMRYTYHNSAFLELFVNIFQRDWEHDRELGASLFGITRCYYLNQFVLRFSFTRLLFEGVYKKLQVASE